MSIEPANMSRGVTEFAFIPLLAGANIEDPSTSAGTVWKECLATAEKQKGFQRLYWGRQIENPSVLEFLVGEFIQLSYKQSGEER